MFNIYLLLVYILLLSPAVLAAPNGLNKAPPAPLRKPPPAR